MSKASETQVVSNGETEATGRRERPVRAIGLVPVGLGRVSRSGPPRSPLFFGTALALRRALFYFDITEINYPYRAFFAEELRAGRFSRWCPGLYCGLPLFSESQAGYLHPLKYLLYPWMQTWQAFNLDTVLSIWLTGLGDLWLAPPSCRIGGGVDRRRGLRLKWIRLGPLDPYQHDQCLGQRSLRHLGPGGLRGRLAAGRAALF